MPISRTIPYLFIAILTANTLAHAQRTERHILSRYSETDIASSLIPRADWKPFPQTAAEWQKRLPDTLQQRLIKKGESWLGKDWPAISASLLLTSVRTGDRTEYSNFQAKRRAHLMSLVLAEAVEGKGRFAEDIMNGIWSTCEETYWGIPVHLYLQKARLGLPDVEEPTVDLVSAETAVMLALTDYLIGPVLDSKSKLLRPRIQYELNRRVLKPMETARYGYLGNVDDKPVNNWNPWIISNWQLTNLLMEKDEARRAKNLRYSMLLLDNYFNSLGDDGGCDEGPSYWFLAGGSTFDALEILNQVTKGKVNVYQEPLVRNMAAYIYKTHIAGNYFINTADASPTITIDAPFLYRIGKAVNDPLLVQLATWAYTRSSQPISGETTTKQRALFDWLSLPEMAKVVASSKNLKAPAPASVWFSDIQLMGAHTGNDLLYVASHGGHNNESHNHNDVGDFIIYANGAPVIIDAGSGTYTAKTFSAERYNSWYNTSPYHNLPTINGIPQSAGRKFEATNVVYTHPANTSDLRMDIEIAYPPTTTLKKWTRTVKTTPQNTIEIGDDYTATAPLKSLLQTFMTICSVNTSQAGKLIFEQANGKKVSLDYDAAKWKVSVEKLPLDQSDDKVFRQKWQVQDIFRVLLTNQSLAAQDKFRYVVSTVN
ncbi:hypothetical protein GO755_04060 [Spirosoma sp. HMF4905]|uniref:Heparinase II/III-like C-terminal domain-containing protein n=1 Tax=Spirosoma arboris TaxID=2682092 RepID=A0A7K1S631_9BACT|nr:heparinase II/III family protein [Spirosoma arboris]MVM29195.1 hypothetical protein [Spirosoma arboris]